MQIIFHFLLFNLDSVIFVLFLCCLCMYVVSEQIKRKGNTMIFTSYEIETNAKNAAIVHLKAGDGSYSIPVITKGIDLRNPRNKRQIAVKAVELLNEKFNTNEFMEVF